MSEYMRRTAGAAGAQLALGADEYSRGGGDREPPPPAPPAKRKAPRVLVECVPGDVVWIAADVVVHGGPPRLVRVTGVRGDDRMCRPVLADGREGEVTTMSGALRVVKTEQLRGTTG